MLVTEAGAICLHRRMRHTEVAVTGIWTITGMTSWMALPTPHITDLSRPAIVAHTIPVHVPRRSLYAVLTV